jgi:hypothetical protein
MALPLPSPRVETSREVPDMTMRTATRLGSQRRWLLVRQLAASHDASHGTSNETTRPRAGNLSSDTRAGRHGRSGA